MTKEQIAKLDADLVAHYTNALKAGRITQKEFEGFMEAIKRLSKLEYVA